MLAHYELETEIPDNHQLILQLPDHIPAGHAKIAIVYESDNIETISKPKTLLSFLGAGKVYHRFASITEIDKFIVENRETWEVRNDATIDK